MNNIFGTKEKLEYMTKLKPDLDGPVAMQPFKILTPLIKIAT
jgi:hypothetical protein